MEAEAMSTLLQALLIGSDNFSKPCMKSQQTHAANLILTVWTELGLEWWRTLLGYQYFEVPNTANLGKDL